LEGLKHGAFLVASLNRDAAVAREARLCHIFCDIRTLDCGASGRIFGFLAYLGKRARCDAERSIRRFDYAAASGHNAATKLAAGEPVRRALGLRDRRGDDR